MKVINKETLYVAFNGKQVAVSSNIPEVIELIERGFSEMLEPEPGRITGRLEVLDEGGNYHLAGNSIASEEYRTLDDTLDLFSKEVIHHIIQANPEFLWLHAGAAAFRRYALLFPGAWGSGKSTTVTSLCEKGWTYLSDDIVPIDMSSDKVFPFFRTPTVRVNSGIELPSHRLVELEKKEVIIRSKGLSQEAVPIGGIVIPFYKHGASARLEPYSHGATIIELLKSCMNFERHGEEAIRYLCKLVERLPVSRVYYRTGDQAANMISHTYKDYLTACRG